MTLASINPMTLAKTAEAERPTQETIEKIHGIAWQAAKEWAETPIKRRADLVRKAGKEFARQAEKIVAVLEEENGKPRTESFAAEILPDIDLFHYHAKVSPKLLADKRVRLDPVAYPGKRATVQMKPRGALLLISPWNFPVAIPLRTILPALVAGNTIVWKPSEHSIKVSRLLQEILGKFFPDGVLNMVIGDGETGSGLTKLRWGRICFTGSVATGRAVARAAAETLTPCSLELGGKDAAIVLADADLERAANGIVWGAFMNAGQSCSSVERVYVEEPAATRFKELVVAKTAALAPGREVGPLSILSQERKVVAQLSAAKEAGTVFLQGGGKGEGLFVEPAILADPGEESPVMCEETFGPILPIVTVNSAAEAILRANATPYGLTASIWTRDLKRGRELAEKLEAGVVTINNHGFTGAVPSLPWTGIKDSGYGVTNGPHALMELCQPTLILEDRSHARREVWWYPYDASLDAILEGMWRLKSGGIAGKLRGLAKLARNFPKRLRLP